MYPWYVRYGDYWNDGFDYGPDVPRTRAGLAGIAFGDRDAESSARRRLSGQVAEADQVPPSATWRECQRRPSALLVPEWATH